MKIIVCDNCKKEINGHNFGKKYMIYDVKGFRITLKVGSPSDGSLPCYDLCQDCLVSLIQSTKQQKGGEDENMPTRL